MAFRGRQTSNGQIVLLHQLTGTNDHTDVLKQAVQYLLRSPASAGGRILDLVEIHGLHYIVTLDQPECLALREWLHWELEGQRVAPAAAGPMPARDPGEFTRQFQNEPTGSRAGLASAPPPAAEPHVPGEFTQLFGRGGQSQPSALPPMMSPPPISPPPMMPAAPAPPPPPLVSEKPQPGEFTRLFRNPLATPAESPISSLPTNSPSTRTPGEFTRIFGGGTPPGTSVPPPPAAMPAPPPPPPTTPGPLTESLDPRHAPTSKPDSNQLAATSAPGEFTRVIRGSGGIGSSPTQPPAPPPAAAAPASPVPTFQAPSLPTAPPPPAAPPAPAPHMPTIPVAAPPAPAAPQAATMGRPSTALIILFVVLLVVALALIAYVILRR